MTDRFSTDQNSSLDFQIYPHQQGNVKTSTSNGDGVADPGILTTVAQPSLGQTSQTTLPDVNGASAQNIRPILIADNSRIPSTSIPSPQTPLHSFYAVQAVKCFLKSIQLAEGNVLSRKAVVSFLGSRLEDTLRLMMLLFDHGDKPEVFENLRDNLKTVPVETWLEVVPQLMARLDSQQNVGLLIKQVVVDVSKAHPQVELKIIFHQAFSKFFTFWTLKVIHSLI